MNTHTIKRQFSLLRIIAVCTLLTGGTIKPSIGGAETYLIDNNIWDKRKTDTTTQEDSTFQKLQSFNVETAGPIFSFASGYSKPFSMAAAAYGSRSLWQNTFTSVVHTSATVAVNCIK